METAHTAPDASDDGRRAAAAVVAAAFGTLAELRAATGGDPERFRERLSAALGALDDATRDALLTGLREFLDVALRTRATAPARPRADGKPRPPNAPPP